MIDPKFLDLAELPSCSLAHLRELPDCAAVYLAVDVEGRVWYVGRAVRLRARWYDHHRKEQLQRLGPVRICWVQVDDPALLPAVEQALIDYFKPPLNRAPAESRANAERQARFRKRRDERHSGAFATSRALIQAFGEACARGGDSSLTADLPEFLPDAMHELARRLADRRLIVVGLEGKPDE